MEIVAIPTRGQVVDDHFGHCEFYTIFNISDDKSIALRETLPSPEGCGCKSNIASVLREKGVTMMLAGNMGNGAKNVLEAQQISVIRGCSGAIMDVVRGYAAGLIKDSGEECHQHAEGHECNH